MYKRNGNKGITLIALVITIIVLIILSAISIGMLTGDNSILVNAEKARKNKAIGDVREAALLAITTAFTEYHAKEVTRTLGTEDSLQSLTDAELQKVKEKFKDDKEMDVKYNDGHFEARYKKEQSTVVLDGTLDNNGIFTWTTLYPSN